MAPDKLFNRIQLEAQTKKLGDDLKKILQRIKIIAVSRSVVEGNNTKEYDDLLGDLDKVEAQIEKLISSCKAWIQSSNRDISEIKQNLLKVKADSGQARAQERMIAEKESEIKFLEMQIQRLDADSKFLEAKENTRYRYYRDRVVERQPAGFTYDMGKNMINDNKYEIEIQCLDNKNTKKGYIKAKEKNNGKIFIVWIEADPPGQGRGALLYKALESLFPPGTIIYFQINKKPLFWLKMGFLLKPFDGEQKAEYYWKRVP